MKIFDVTRSLSRDTLVYPGDCAPSFIQRDAGNYLISELYLSSHTGTHIDAPVHYLKKGETIDVVPLNNLIGKCRVLDVSTAGPKISNEDLEEHIDGVSRLLLRTQFSGTNLFVEDYPSMDGTAARLISKQGLKCIGIDSPSIESYHCDGEVHREILGHGCSIIELLDLAAVEEGDYMLIALPLRLAGLVGSPARVVLLKSEEEDLWT
jgi:arylformamidase